MRFHGNAGGYFSRHVRLFALTEAEKSPAVFAYVDVPPSIAKQHIIGRCARSNPTQTNPPNPTHGQLWCIVQVPGSIPGGRGCITYVENCLGLEPRGESECIQENQLTLTNSPTLVHADGPCFAVTQAND